MINRTIVGTYEYLTVEETIRRNGYRHEFRGYYWLELGYDDRAAGSFRKAKREFAKADKFKWGDTVFDNLLMPIVELLKKKIAESILHGDIKI
jgi:hypothetical protein